VAECDGVHVGFYCLWCAGASEEVAANDVEWSDDSRNRVAQCAGGRELDADVLVHSVQADGLSMGAAQLMVFWERVLANSGTGEGWRIIVWGCSRVDGGGQQRTFR